MTQALYPLAASDDFARWLAFGSFLIGALGLGLGILNYLQNRVRVRVWVGRRTRWWQVYFVSASRVMWVPVRAINKGRLSVDVLTSWWEVSSRHTPTVNTIDRPKDSMATPDAPEVFPVSLPALGTRTWLTRTRGWDSAAHETDTYRVRYCVRLGNGRLIRSNWVLTKALGDVAHVDARALDRAAFPRLWRPMREVLRTKRGEARNAERWKERRAERDKRRFD